jgi:hypothetical protein
MQAEFDINPTYEAFYIESLLWHTNSALDAIKEIGDWIEFVIEDNPKALDLPKEELFQKLQLIIQHAASISKFFWPIRKGEKGLHKKRGRKLRTSLSISEDSALKSRVLRDHIEHFDEKLDVYLTSNFVGEFIPQDVGLEYPEGEVPLHIFKGFYINPRIFVLLGNKYELIPIVQEVERIHDILLECVNCGYRLRSA